MEDNDDDEQTSIQVDDTRHKKEYKPSILKFKSQSFDDLSRMEWLSLVLSILPVVCAAALSFKTFAEENPDSSQFTLATALVITMVFLLLVYQVHGVLMRMPYSLLLHCLFDMVVVAYCIMYYRLPNDDRKFKIAFLVLGTTAGVVDVLLALHLFRKYWQARTMTFPCGAETLNQDANVKHLFTMCLLLLDLHLELTFVALVLRIDKTGLATLEIVKLVGGVTYSTSMCFLGFVFLFQKWKPLVFVIPLASLAEFAYIIYNLVVTGLNWQGFHDEVIPAFIIAVSIANLAARSSVCGLLIYIYKKYRTEVETGTHLSDMDSAEQTSGEAGDSTNKKFKRQSVADLSVREWIFLNLHLFTVGFAFIVLVLMFDDEKTDSAHVILTIVLCVTTVFLAVYPVMAVFWRMHHSLILHSLCYMAFLTYLRAYNEKQLTKGARIALVVWAVIPSILFLQYLFKKYRKTRADFFPCGAEKNNQDMNFKHPFVICLLLLDLYLELTFVVFVLKIDETGLTPLEIVKLVVGVIYSITMCVLGFLFLYKKWIPLVFVICRASLIELAYIIYNLVVTGQTLESFPNKVIPAVIVAVSIANLASKSLVCRFLSYVCKHIGIEVASCNKDRRYSYGNQLLGVCCTKCGQEWLEDGCLFPPGKGDNRSSVTVDGVVLKKQVKMLTEANTSFQVKCSRTKITNFKSQSNVLKVGDHITWPRRLGYWHHAIVLEIGVGGRVKVIHWCNSDNKWQITQTDLDLIVGESFRIDYPDEIATANPSKLVLARARSRLYHTGYSLFHDNCETFATYCKTGRAESCQVGWLFLKLIAILQTTVVKCAATEIVKAVAAETVEMFWGMSHAVGFAVLAVLEIFFSAFDICKIRKSRNAGEISRHDRMTSVIRRLVEASFGVGVATGLGIAGSYIPSAVGAFIGGILVNFVGGVLGKFLGTCIGLEIGRKLVSRKRTDDRVMKSIEDLKQGDQIVLHHDNHAIVVGPDLTNGKVRVVHYTAEQGVVEELIDFKPPVYRLEYNDCYSPEEVIQRARSKIGDQTYMSSKTFAKWCKRRKDDACLI